MKSVAQSTPEEINLEKGFLVLCFKNDSITTEKFNRDIDSNFIQLHFCLKGSITFNFNNGNYSLDVLDKHAILLYNTSQKLPINLNIRPKTALVSILISIEKFHALFSKESSYISFLNQENKNKKYYNNAEISSVTLMVLQQILNKNIDNALEELYIKGKIYELLSLHFNTSENTDDEYCPFLGDDTYITKIRKAKDIIISQMAEPPSLQELANQVGLNIKKLKEGFKQIYGDSVYSFLLDYKMEHARKLLETNKYNVNEVGGVIGYSAASHFIAAFKKKYGTTPKRYVTSL